MPGPRYFPQPRASERSTRVAGLGALPPQPAPGIFLLFYFWIEPLDLASIRSEAHQCVATRGEGRLCKLLSWWLGC
jgi:hypothetical protein